MNPEVGKVPLAVRETKENLTVLNAIRNLRMEDNVRRAICRFVEMLRNAEGDNLVEVDLFGSYARGEAVEGSDVDLAVLLQESENMERERAIWRMSWDILAESDFEVDISPFVVTRARLDGPLMPVIVNIANEGIVLYERV